MTETPRNKVLIKKTHPTQSIGDGLAFWVDEYGFKQSNGYQSLILADR
jgi:hypothetical protein